MTRHIAIGGLLVFLLATTLGVALADPPAPDKPPHGTPTANKEQSAKEGEKGGKRRGLFGKVVAISGNALSLVTQQGSVMVTTNNSTRIHIPSKRNASLNDLAVGDRVAIQGTPNDAGFIANRASVAPGKPSVQHRVGTVQSYTPGASIKIVTVQGDVETFSLSAETDVRNDAGRVYKLEIA